MKKYYKRRFCLTDQGVQTLTRATFNSFFVYCVNILPMILLMLLTDQLVMQHHTSPWLYLGLALVTLVLLWSLLSREYVSLYNATYQESANLRVSIFETLANLPLAYFSKHDLSDLAQTVMADVAAIEHALSHSVPKVMAMAMFFPLLSILMLLGNPLMGIAVIIPSFLSFALIPLSKKISLAANKRYYTQLRKNSEDFQEAIELSQEINSFNLADSVKAHLNKQMDQSEKIHLSSEMVSFILMSSSTLFSFVSLAVVVFVGSLLIMRGELSVLYLVGYLVAAIKIKELLDISKEGVMEMYYITPAIERIREIKDTPQQTGDDTRLESFNVAVNDVSFGYDDTKPVLQHVSFEAPQNQITALVGPSGCGKSSLLRLISRLYDPQAGSVFIGGKEITSLSTDALFKHVSIVFQDVMLFNTSVMENIRLGRRDASDEEVLEAAKLAHCMDFIDELPEGFNTPIGENGAELSGGQRQRISIARAFLKDAPILLLDEISANLDIDNEQKIQASLTELVKNKTVIVVSHRLRSIENVDRIIVLNDGRIEASGTHEALLATSPTYQNLIEKTAAAEAFVY